jgi:hypothetical protein
MYLLAICTSFEDVGGKELLYTVHGNVNYFSHYGNHCGGFSKKYK